MVIKTIRHIKTHRNIRGFRSCPHAVGLSMRHFEQDRVKRGDASLATRQMQRAWLDMQYYLRQLEQENYYREERVVR